MNYIQKFSLALTAAIGIGGIEAQAGGFNVREVLVNRTYVDQVPVYGTFDTFARTQCGPQYAGSYTQQIGTVPQMRTESKVKREIFWDQNKIGLLDMIFTCPKPRCAPAVQFNAPVAPFCAPAQGPALTPIMPRCR